MPTDNYDFIATLPVRQRPVPFEETEEGKEKLARDKHQMDRLLFDIANDREISRRRDTKRRAASQKKQAKEKLEGALFPNTQAVLTGMGSSIVGGAFRLAGDTEEADRYQRMKSGTSAAIGEMDEGGFIPPALKRAARGAAETIPTMVLAGAATGGWGAIAYAAATEADSAITAGKDAGLTGDALTSYVMTKGAIEGGVAGVFQLAGLGGIEKMIGGRGAAAIGTQAALKKLGFTLLKEELPEELLTEFAHAIADKMASVDKEDWTIEQVTQIAFDTTLQTAITMGIVGVPGVSNASKEAGRRAEISKYAREGRVPSRSKFKEWGLSPDRGSNRAERAETTGVLAEQYRTESAKIVDAIGEDDQQQAETVAQEQQGAQSVAPEELLAPMSLQTPTPQESSQGDSDAFVEVTPLGGGMSGMSSDVKVDESAGAGESGSFITDNAGRVAVSTAAIGRLTNKTQRVMQRFLTTRGEFPQEIYDAKVKRDAVVSRAQREIGMVNGDLNRALDEVYGPQTPIAKKKRKAGLWLVPEITQQQELQLDDAIRGNVKISSLPAPLRGPIRKMRSKLDGLSQRLIDIGAVQGDLSATVARNKGTYMTRAYQAWTTPGWAEKVPADVRNRAVKFIRDQFAGENQGRILTPEQIDGRIEAYLGDKDSANNPLAAAARSHLGAKDTGILKERKEVPKEIRDLLGEFHDPRISFAKSITKMTELIANHEFAKKIRNEGMGTFFSHPDTGPISSPYGVLKAQIEAGPDSPIAPLAGLWTTQEIKDAFVRATETKDMPGYLKLYLQANGLVKVAKTVWSSQAEIRNFFANAGFAIANNHWRAFEGKGSALTAIHGLANMEDNQYRKDYLEAIEYGIVNQDTRASELRANLKDIASNGFDTWAFDVENKRAKGARKLVKKTVEGATSLYQFGDDIWKLYAWHNERARYRKAYPSWTEDELKTHTANIVTNTYPTYSRIPEITKLMRQFPVTGAFVSFTSEVFRTSYHTAKLSAMEMSRPETRSIGAQRAVGQLIALSGTGALSMVARLLYGIDRNKDEMIREFAAPWQKNAQLVHNKSDGNGEWTFTDMSYLDPHNALLRPVIAVMRAEDPAAGLWDGMVEMMNPFAGEEILWRAVTEIGRNQKAGGGQVYNPQMNVDNQAGDVMMHLWKAFEPGIVTSGRRIVKAAKGQESASGKKYKLGEEVLSALGAVRRTTIDVRQALPYKVRDYSDDIRDADKELLSAMTRRGNVEQSELYQAYNKTRVARERIFEDLIRTRDSAIKLGVSMSEVDDIIKGGSISELDMRQIRSGNIPMIRLTKERLRRMRVSDPAGYEGRLDAITRAYQEDASERQGVK